AFIANPQLLSLLTYKGASLSLRHGNGPWSPFFFSVIGLLLCGAIDTSPSDESAEAVKTAQQLQKVALNLLDNPNNTRCKSKTLEAITSGILHWNEPLKKSLDMSLKTYEAGLETGDLASAALGIYHFANFGLDLGMNLDDFQQRVSTYNQRAKTIGHEFIYSAISIRLQTAQ
ncbi:serine/threonine kinase with two-component sensor domain protein, partial [Candidatus Thiomargarita nelsonii]